MNFALAAPLLASLFLGPADEPKPPKRLSAQRLQERDRLHKQGELLAI